MFKKNTAITGFTFTLINSSDGSSITSGTVNSYVTIDGGIQTATTALATHEGNGQWSINLTAAEMNGDLVGLLFTHDSAVPAHFTIKTDTKLVGELADVTASQVNTEASNAISSAALATASSLATVDTVVDSIQTDLSNVTYGLGAIKTAIDAVPTNNPSAATIRSEIDANSTQLSNIAADTSQLQTDWADGGRLDTILDAKASQASVDAVDSVVDGIQVDLSNGTDGLGAIKSAVDSVPTASQIADAVLEEALAGHSTLGTLGKALADIELDVANILSDTNELQTDDVPGLISALNNIDASTVNTQVTAALNSYDVPTKTEMDAGFAAVPTVADIGNITITELTSLPAASPALKEAIGLLYMALRNKVSITNTTKVIHNSAGSALATKTLADDNTTYSESKMV